MIRSALPADFKALKPLFKLAHARSPMSSIPIDWTQVRRMLAVASYTPAFHIEVVEHEGKIVGCLAGLITLNVWGVKVATDLFVYSRRETDLLIQRFRDWAKRSGAEVLSLTNISGRERYDRLIERSGLTRVGSTFLEVI